MLWRQKTHISCDKEWLKIAHYGRVRCGAQLLGRHPPYRLLQARVRRRSCAAPQRDAGCGSCDSFLLDSYWCVCQLFQQLLTRRSAPTPQELRAHSLEANAVCQLVPVDDARASLFAPICRNSLFFGQSHLILRASPCSCPHSALHTQHSHTQGPRSAK